MSGNARPTTHVTFVCQKCAQPIKLNRTLQSKALVDIAHSLEEKFKLESVEWTDTPDGSHDELPSSSRERQTENKEEGGALNVVQEETGDSADPQPILRPRSSPHVRRRSSLRRASQSSLETLSVVYGSLSPNHTDRNQTTKQIKIAAEAFKLLSMNTDVDHPLCVECPEEILDKYEQQIMQMEEAKRHYGRMAASLETEVKEYNSQMSGLDSELEELRKEEEMLKAKLLQTEDKRRQIAEEMKTQKEREAKLKEEEQVYWREFNEHQRKMLHLKDDQLSVQYQLQYTTEQLNRLKKTNVLNSAFYIWHNGHFGTINGLRLGRLQTVSVEWTEINAAWGQTAFLLNTLARLSGIKFERYKLVPYGNNSFLEVIEGKKKILPLHSSVGFRFFNDSKFDSAMVAFLDCLNQLKVHIETNSQPHFMLPYKIDKDKIGDIGKEFYSVKTQFNTPERWTKALKFVLTNLRWALTWVAANSMQRPID